MAVFKKDHYYVRNKEYDKSSLGIKEIMPIEDRTVSEMFFLQYEDMTRKRDSTTEER